MTTAWYVIEHRQDLEAEREGDWGVADFIDHRDRQPQPAPQPAAVLHSSQVQSLISDSQAQTALTSGKSLNTVLWNLIPSILFYLQAEIHYFQ